MQVSIQEFFPFVAGHTPGAPKHHLHLWDPWVLFLGIHCLLAAPVGDSPIIFEVAAVIEFRTG